MVDPFLPDIVDANLEVYLEVEENVSDELQDVQDAA